jgi:hypothetical protein
MAEYTWTGWGRPGKCTPIPGEALVTFECLHCERIITAESDPEQDCPKANISHRHTAHNDGQKASEQ